MNTVSVTFILNRRLVTTEIPTDTVLLDHIRTREKLTGTKQACREGDCGACSVLLGRFQEGGLTYRAVNSCLLPMAAVHGCHVVTIEGLNAGTLTPIQQALADNGGVQCGFCTPGFVVAVTAYFLNAKTLNVDDSCSAVSGNLCRCTGYMGIKRALRQLVRQYTVADMEKRLPDLIDRQILPPYFETIPERLAAIPAPPETKPGPDALMVAGGTDLFVHPPQRFADREWVFPDTPQEIRLTPQGCRIKAGTTLETLKNALVMNELFPQFSSDMQMICTPPIRERATIGGNLANASPIADMAVFFLALDAQLLLISRTGERRSVALKNFFKDYKQVDLQIGERIDELRFVCPQPPLSFSFEKVGKRRYADIAGVNSALFMELRQDILQTVHLSAGGVAPVPLYLEKTCAYLSGRPISSAGIRQALDIAQTEITPISDLRGSSEYKRLLLRQLIIAHFVKLLPDFVRAEDLL
ncbi:FAD binding domain-containing protein [Desulfococcus multivorans]|uniref:Molybdopterin dehydrogenase FAD-binding protein n=1 Tax=Desulfococcus multivorans DSM 2059 TaxID=1121405 RepID=S7V1B5_DESML|nr:FAD binding domain-containing protein [Desulfococcus multivorans]AOY60453.1 XdhC: predicted xanthine dehydrogenase, iron-sulfur-binding subunit [Desulfococcus multivorans]AQV02546.1 molybdopterin dehydrogenase [Desulfococcus multivorans]EPR40269.1 molybdopterin dehydrogenase FAD-binding protein [Desulfococcus multivorans DSM 2059]SJZ61877.1 xanthine dehydrogenase small subunit [Desulfococcus multivorans DSM 2059]